jgi:hypothetical protein
MNSKDFGCGIKIMGDVRKRGKRTLGQFSNSTVFKACKIAGNT